MEIKADATPEETEIIDLERVAHGGYCVGRRANGKVILVRHGLPGERVKVAIQAQRSKVDYGEVCEVLQASADRVPQVWPQAGAGGVGGAELGHVAYPAQLRWKAQVLADTARRIGSAELAEQLRVAGGGEISVSGVGADPSSRTRVEYVISAQGRPALHRANSPELVEVSELPLAASEIAQLEPFSSAWRYRPGERIRLVVPSASRPVMVRGNQVWGAPGKAVSRAVREELSYAGKRLRYRVRAAGFWQAHCLAPELLCARVGQGAQVEADSTVVELYAGAGLFSVALGGQLGRQGRLYTLEGEAKAVADARQNLQAAAQQAGPQGFAGQWEAAAGPVNPRSLAAWADELSGAVVVLDPPRAGAGRAVMQAICEKQPLRIVLVSCDPAAGARDLQAGLEGGYQVTKFGVLDLFPHTSHMECVAVLERS